MRVCLCLFKLREDTNLSLSKELLKTLNFKTDGSGDTDTEESSSKPSTPKTQFQVMSKRA